MKWLLFTFTLALAGCAPQGRPVKIMAVYQSNFKTEGWFYGQPAYTTVETKDHHRFNLEGVWGKEGDEFLWP